MISPWRFFGGILVILLAPLVVLAIAWAHE